MNIAIIGTRGIPNYYGGFEQFAEYLSIGLVKRGFNVSVYNSHTHPYQEKTWNGVNIIHCYDAENKIGTAGQFIYDFNCIINSRKQKFDIILLLGYTSSSVWGRLLPRRNTVITTNMDGLEWKRSKYSKMVRKFLLYAEKLAVEFSDYYIADSIGIQQYLNTKYNVNSIYIPYGSYCFENPHEKILESYNVSPYNYNMIISRLEPENSIEPILKGAVQSQNAMPFLVVGNTNTKYGNYIVEIFKSYPNVHFLGSIYDINILNNLRYFSNLYFHGHTVGGTNPSLLEAMGSSALICAHDNSFNKSILGEDALYFQNQNEITGYMNTIKKSDAFGVRSIKNNLQKIREVYNWDRIIDQYADHFKEIYEQKLKQGH